MNRTLTHSDLRHAGIGAFFRPRDIAPLGVTYYQLQGMVAEMETGEGKTLTATLPAATAALAGIPVHVVTVNDYLAGRDAEAMGPLYRALGLSVGLVVSGMDLAARRAAYACDVTYCTNKEVAFDYLKDRRLLGVESWVAQEEDPCELYFADYRPVDGRQLPHRIEVRHGDKRYAVLSIKSYQLGKK